MFFLKKGSKFHKIKEMEKNKNKKAGCWGGGGKMEERGGGQHF